MKRPLLLLISLTFLSFGTNAESFLKDIQSLTLPNGMKILVKPVHEAPLVKVQLSYHVGFRDSLDGLVEMPHFVEHMMFKGAKDFNKDELTLKITENGGWLNGFTSREYTSYIEMVPSPHLETVLQIESSRMMGSLFLDKDIEDEKKVLASEIRNNAGAWTGVDYLRDLSRALGQPDWTQFDMSSRLAGIEKITPDAARTFYKTYYRPDNAVLVVAGDVEAPRVFDLCKKYFGPLASPAAAIPQKVYPFQPITDAKTVTGRGRAKEPFGSRYFNFKAYDPKDREIVLAKFLVESGIVPEIAYETYKEGGYLVQNFTNPAPMPLAVLDWKTIETRFPIEKKKVLERRDFGYESLDQITQVLTDNEMLNGNWDYGNWLTEAFKTVAYPELKAFLEKYLAPQATVTGVFELSASTDAPAISFNGGTMRDNFSELKSTDFLDNPDPAAAAAYDQKASDAYESLRPRLEAAIKAIGTFSLPNGLKVIYRQSLQTRKTWVNLLVPAGIQYENAPFVSSYTGAMVFEGGPQVFLKKAIQEAGGSYFYPYIGLQWTTAGVFGKDEILPEMLEALALGVRDRSFNRWVLETKKEDNLRNLKNPGRDQKSVIQREFGKLFAEYGQYVDQRDQLEAPARAAVTMDQVNAFYKDRYRPQGSILVVTSPLDAMALEPLVTDAFGGWKNPDLPAPSPRLAEKVPQAEKETQRFAKLDNTRENLVVFEQGLTKTNLTVEDSQAFYLTNQTLNSFTGRLMRNLRVKEALTYGIGTFFDRGGSSWASIYGGWLLASPENLDKAIAGFKSHLKTFLKEGPKPVELAFARNQYLNGFAFGMENVARIHDLMVQQAKEGLSPDILLKAFDKAASLSSQELLETVGKYLDPEKFFIVTAGPGRK